MVPYAHILLIIIDKEERTRKTGEEKAGAKNNVNPNANIVEERLLDSDLFGQKHD